MRLDQAKGEQLRELARSCGYDVETDEEFRARVVRKLSRVCRLGTTSDFANIADEALSMHGPVALDLATMRRCVLYAWAQEYAYRSRWRGLLARFVVWAFFLLARGR